MAIISVVQPHEMLSASFKFDGVDKKWKVRLLEGDPFKGENLIGMADAPNLSDDEKGIGLHRFAVQAFCRRYSLVADNLTKKVRLVESIPSEIADAEGWPMVAKQETVVGEFDLNVMNATMDDVAINNGVLTFTDNSDPQNIKTFVLDTNNLASRIVTAGSANINLFGDGTSGAPLVANLVIRATDAGFSNLLKSNTSGAYVDRSDILDLLNTETTLNSYIDTVNENFVITVSGKESTTPLHKLLNSAGDQIGWILS